MCVTLLDSSTKVIKHDWSVMVPSGRSIWKWLLAWLFVPGKNYEEKAHFTIRLAFRKEVIHVSKWHSSFEWESPSLWSVQLFRPSLPPTTLRFVGLHWGNARHVSKFFKQVMSKIWSSSPTCSSSSHLYHARYGIIHIGDGFPRLHLLHSILTPERTSYR